MEEPAPALSDGAPGRIRSDGLLPAGLRLSPSDVGGAVRATILAVFAVCILVTLTDVVFRGALPREYLEHYTAPMWPRSLVACLEALREELVYRLFLLSAFAALPALLRGGKAGSGWMIVGIALVQLVNVGALAAIFPPYGAIRFWLVGCVWGWLYWRHGFASALTGHGLSHLLLDPMLFLALGGSL